ncbi:MAG: 2-oxo acid dehydrogenase subunit E2 [Magnetococcales bacterium]|nr:2-oxo acid dehydrogenase subunit E2 [Magnetococcales bacterium]
MPKTFNLPELGENIHGGDLVRVTVAVGDRIVPGHPLLEIETDKAVIEVPANLSGTVLEILVKPGTKIQVGQPVLSVEVAEENMTASVAATALPDPARNPQPVASSAPSAPPVAAITPAPAAMVAPPPVAQTLPVAATPAADRSTPAASIKRGPVPASPSVRREARELGVEIRNVVGSGPHGRITLQDVRQHVRQCLQQMPASASLMPAASSGLTLPCHGPLPDFSRWGAITAEPMNNVRRTTAIHLAATWNTIPQVTGYERADITDLEAARKKLSANLAKSAGVSLTLTVILVKVMAIALRLFPKFNAAVDMTRQEVIYKKYVHIGIAVDTPHGLLVPVLRDADQKSLSRLATELADLSARARDRKLKPEEMQGGCLTISNLGGLGGTGFNPIINYPEVAILGVSQGRREPLYDDQSGGFQPRLMLPLSLSYDHRLIDGGDGTRFLRWVRDALEQPLLLLMEG